MTKTKTTVKKTPVKKAATIKSPKREDVSDQFYTWSELKEKNPGLQIAYTALDRTRRLVWDKGYATIKKMMPVDAYPKQAWEEVLGVKIN